MHRSKLVALVALLGLVLIFDPDHTTAQFGKRDGGTPGGFGPPGGGGPPGGFGKGGFKMDPEMAWSMLQRSTQSTGDTIDLSKMDPRMRDFSRQRAERDGSIPLPDSGIMTKSQYLDHFARSEAAKAAKAAAGGAPGGPPGGPGSFGAPMVVTLGPGGPAPGGPAPFAGPGGPGGFSAPGGGEDRGAQRLKEQDKDRDGRVSFAEADDRLKQNFQVIDRNGDGHVDVEEYRAYYANRDRGGSSGPAGPGGGFNGGGFNGGNWGDPNAGGWGNRDRKDEKKDTVEPKPVAMRYGYLPKDLPEWFDKYDGDKDGQVALHEWRKAGDEIAKFLDMDLNGDGLITADELLRFNLKTAEDAKIAALNGEGGGSARPAPSFASGGRGPGSGGFSLPGSTPSDKASATSDKGSDKSSKGDKPNPFREGGFGKKPRN
ncbi:MAG: hypothetical protein C0467_09505 [Planctomycetaceae bacterium]|nr:hypothetical protein [Planctomycetaceae bacterium]